MAHRRTRSTVEDGRSSPEEVTRTPQPLVALRGAVGDAPPLTAGNLLTLQGASGNRALSTMIGREPEGGTATKGAPSADATGADAATLDKDWDAAVKGGLWDRAVGLALQLMEKGVDLTSKLEALTYDQITALQAAVTLGSVPGDGFLSRVGKALSLRLAIEPIRVKKLTALYEPAVNAEQWDKAVGLLDGYGDADLLPKARLIKTKGAAKLGAALTAATTKWADDNHRVRRTLSFLSVEDLTGSGVRPVTSSGVTGGTSEAAVKVPETGGSVTFTKGATDGSTSNIYGLSYAGADAQTTGWIQFIARNIEKFDDKGASLGYYAGTWTPSGQGARSFSTSAAPSWYLDTLSDQAPFYEASSKAAGGGQGLSDISAAKTAMYDAPSGRVDIVAPLFTDAKVKSVRSRATFDTYLVHEMQVLRHETITVEYTFDAAQAAVGSDTTPTTTHTGGGQTSSLPTDRYKAMTTRFPKFAYLPHG